ncbi:MAG: universal stress protein [Proteobacteria bacterium]|nr:universal stress protein [Pseudomonadota bacterium]
MVQPLLENFPANRTTQLDREGNTSAAPGMKKKSFILVVTRNGHMAEPVMDYAITVADRLKYAILAVHTNTLPFFRDGGERNRLFAAAMQESSALFRQKAEARDVQVEHTGETGKIGKIVKRLCHTEKRIEFVIIDQGIRMEEVTSMAPVPVFSVIYTRSKAGAMTTHSNPMNTGDSRMSTTSRKRHVKNCFVFGGLTAGLYAAVFSHPDIIMTYLTKGGFYALLPVAVVLTVSYMHGNFTNSFWAALGIEGSNVKAPKQADVRQEKTDVPTVKKDTRPRAQVSA